MSLPRLYSLFGLAFDEKRYKEVLRVCQLTTDLDLLEDGGMFIADLWFSNDIHDELERAP
jgi:hypothetical protein